MVQSDASGSERVRRWLQEAGFAAEILHFDASARTAAEAARAIGCSVAQIAKSLIFNVFQSRNHILVIASGANRVNESRVAAAIGEPIAKADAAFVRERTGYAIGGVAPIAHAVAPRHVLIDADLTKLNPIWTAAGHPHSVFRVSFGELLRLTAGAVMQIT